MKKIMLALVLAVCAVNAKDFMLVIDLDKVIDSEDFKEIVGDEIAFSFGSGSKEKIIARGATSRDRVRINKDDYFTKSLSGKKYEFSEMDKKCGYSLLQNLADLKKQAQKVGGTKVVNIESYRVKSDSLDSKDSFQCAVRKSKATVKLKADFAK